MKKLLGFGLIVTILLASCAKEKGRQQDKDTNYHFTFKVNGSAKAYTGYIYGHLDTTNNIVELTVLGAPSVTSYDDYLGFYLSNDDGNGKLSAGQFLDTETNHTILATHVANAVEYEAGQSVAMDAVTDGVTITNHFKFTITSIDKNAVRGTFGGDFFANGDAKNGAKLSITEGDFYVQII